MLTGRTWILASASILFMGSALVAQPSSKQNPPPEWHPPFEEDEDGVHSLGSILEEEFAATYRSCNLARRLERVGGRRLSWSRNRAEISRVPTTLQAIRNIDLPMAPAQHSSLARLFAYVSGPGQDPLRADTIDEKRRLAMDWVARADLMIPDGESRNVENHSCASSLQSAAAAGLQLNVPFARITAAGEYVKNSRTALTLSIVEGTFVSPIEEYIHGSRYGAAHRLFGNLIVWEWYRRNREALKTGGQYRTRFQGVAIVRRETGNMDQTTAASFASGVTTTFARVEASIKGDFRNTEDRDVQRYTTAEYSPATRGDSAGRVRALPTPADVRRDVAIGFNNNVPTRVNAEQDEIIQPGPAVMVWRVEGIPRQLCEDGAGWKLHDGIDTTALRLIRVREAPSGTANRPWNPCEIHVEFTPPIRFWTNPPNDTTIRLSLANLIPGDTARITVGPFEAKLNTRRTPQLLQTGQAGGQWLPRISTDSSAGFVRRTVYWDPLVFNVVEDQARRVSWGQGYVLDSLQIRCPGNKDTIQVIPLRARNTTVSPPGYVPGSLPLTGTLSVPLSWTTRENLDLSTPRDCTLQGSVTFRIRNGTGSSTSPVSNPLPEIPITIPSIAVVRPSVPTTAAAPPQAPPTSSAGNPTP